MKILYLTDHYAWKVMGVKRSLMETLQSFGHEVAHVPYAQHHPKSRYGRSMERMGEGPLFRLCLKGDHSHIFFASSGLSFEPRLMEQLHSAGKILAGFGFSDPRYVQHARGHWHHFDLYVTQSSEIARDAKIDGVKSVHMLPSVHPGFHDSIQADWDSEPEFNAVFLGKTKGHPEAEYRAEMIGRLRDQGLSILAIGTGGDLPHTEGRDLLGHLCRARVGLNFRTSTTTHKIFEYAAAGLCVCSDITEDVARAFNVGTEILPLAAISGFANAIEDIDGLRWIAKAGHDRCMKDHTMASRVSDILAALRV